MVKGFKAFLQVKGQEALDEVEELKKAAPHINAFIHSLGQTWRDTSASDMVSIAILEKDDYTPKTVVDALKAHLPKLWRYNKVAIANFVDDEIGEVEYWIQKFERVNVNCELAHVPTYLPGDISPRTSYTGNIFINYFDSDYGIRTVAINVSLRNKTYDAGTIEYLHTFGRKPYRKINQKIDGLV